jgi:alanyl-tRNA synthetase
LLQKALKTVLGSHVEQKGSFVSPTRLRFDFAHFQALTPDEIHQVEDLVNQEIAAALPVRTDLMSLEDARKSGAMALFDEKYGDVVRVVSMGEFSKELCGGTHVSNTGEIQFFKILSDSGISSGVRRIEALTGQNLIRYYEQQETLLHEAAKALKAEPAEVPERIGHLQSELKASESEMEKLKNKLAEESLGDVTDRITEVEGVRLLAAEIPETDGNELRNLGDQIKEKIGEGVILLVSAKDGKVSLVAMVTEEAQKKGAHAGNLVRAAAKIVGGGGGGRPNMAQAGGKNAAAIPTLLEEAPKILADQIGK